MRRIRSTVAIAASLVAFVAASSVQGATTDRLWVAGYGSWNTYSMSGGASSNSLFSSLLKSRKGEIGNGGGLGFELGVDLHRPVALGFGYERFFASDVHTSLVGNVEEPFSARTEIRLPANSFYGFAEYRLASSGRAGARLGLAGGLVTLAPVSRAALSIPPGGDLVALILTGTGPLLKVYATGELRAGQDFVLFASGGYRLAKVDQPRDHDIAISDFSADYSGATARVGVKLALMK